MDRVTFTFYTIHSVTYLYKKSPRLLWMSLYHGTSFSELVC